MINVSDFQVVTDYETANLNRSLYVPVQYCQAMINDMSLDNTLLAVTVLVLAVACVALIIYKANRKI